MILLFARYLVGIVIVAWSWQVGAELPVQKCNLKIGVLADLSRNLSGTNQPFGYEIENGVKLAGSYLSVHAGNTSVSYEVFDISGTNANIPTKIDEGMKKGIRFFIGLGSSDQAQIGKEAALGKNVVLITPTATSDTLVELKTNLVLISPRNSLIIADLVNYLIEQHIKTAGIVYAKNSIYSRNITEEFVKQFKSKGGEIEAVYPIRSGIGNIEDDLQRITELKSKNLFIPLYELDAAKTISYLQKNNLDKFYIGTDAWGTYSQAIHLLVNSQELHAVYTQLYQPIGTTFISNWFLKNYKNTYKKMPTDLAAFSFDATLLASQINQRCGLQHIGEDGISGCLEKVKKFDGAGGVVGGFYLNSANRHAAIRTIVRGKYETP